MKAKRNIRQNFILGLFLIPIFMLSTNIVFAGSTGTTNLVRQFGSGYSSAGGDYISASIANGGLNLPYYYYIEVPSGLNRLRVSIYDADVGRGSANDWLSGTWNTSCTYTLYDPSGTNRGSITGSATQGTNGNWQNIISTTSNLIAGHWQLVVNMTSAVTTGDDLNGYGIRADNGDSSSGGTELNVYAHSFIPVGRVGTGSSTNTFYPYVTSGCTVDWNDWDGDNLSVHTYSSRTGENTGSFSGSGSTAWQNYPISNYETDLINNDSGIWTWTGTYTDTGAGGNFGVFYAGNYNAANPPNGGATPSAQPETDTFRVYLPTDGGGAPSKPVVTQKISFVSGPNPPTNGSTTRVRVEIAVYNPAAQAITFSSPTNLVTANIPGSGVVYAGNTVLSPGTTIVSQPSIGGTGNLTWNPGSVAAGATATLYYQVDVTPASPGQRLPVTGTPALNGTTARYVDETGHAATGTYTYGPLCGLAVTEGPGNDIPTWVAVSCFEACAFESQPTVEWHTGTEAGTVGFYLWRQDKETKEYELVNPYFLPALPNAPQGGFYRLSDPGAFSGEPVTYRLEEVDARGRRMSYGPFTVTFGAPWDGSDERSEKMGGEEASEINGYQRFRREWSEYERERLRERQQARQSAMVTASSMVKNKERARITVKGRGLFYVTSAQVAGSLGISQPKAELLIAQYRFSLTGMGREIAWLADGNGAGIFFYNEGLETEYTDRNVYFLEQGSGRAMETVNGGNAGVAPEGQTYRETLRVAESHYFLPSLAKETLADDWFWDYVVAGSRSRTFTVSVPGPAAAGAATLRVVFRGATDTASDSDHHAVVTLNGSEVGSASWDGGEDHALEVSFSASKLVEGPNTIGVSGVLDTGAPYSIFYVDGFELGYPRYYKAEGNVLLCRGDGNSVITVGGVTEAEVVVLDVSKAERPKQVRGVAPDLGGRVTFVPKGPAREYLLSGLNAALRPLAVKGDRPSRLKSAGNAAEYVVIAPEELEDAAAELADYRQGRGLKTMVVTVEDIYDSFNNGMPSPYAIRDFLAHAYEKWGGKKVKYAVMAGKGTYDYKDYLGLGDNLVPVILAKSTYGYYAADRVFGDVAGKNGVPEIAIGRLPAVTAAELRAMIGKVKAYEGNGGAWAGRALFIADNADDGGDFAAGSDELAALAAGFQAEKIYLSGAATEERARIAAAWNEGAGLVNYCGHAGMTQLAQENLLNVAGAQALRNGGRLPLLVALTCVAGRFEVPGYTSLGEALALNRKGGMAGGLVPSGAGMHADSLRLVEAFYRAALLGKGMSAGQALVAAMKEYVNNNGAKYLLNVYNWLGDPALEFK